MLIDWETFADKTNSEHAHQTALFGWAAKSEYHELRFMFAVPNGFMSSPGQKAKMKAEGLRVGCPDIWLPVQRLMYNGCVIEMKVPAANGKRKGTVDPEQKVWLEYLPTQGYFVSVCYGFHEARQTLINYLNFPKRSVW